MSDVFTKRRPMIDLNEFERRLCLSCSTDQKDGDPFAELLRIIGGKDESHETDFEPKTQLSARAWQEAGEPGELNQPDAQVRLVGGDFAAIEAGLLGTKQPQAAIPSEAERSTVEYKRPNARAPLISGDFAAIEAGLLGAPREQATATVSEANMSNAFSSVDIGSQRFRPASAAQMKNVLKRPLAESTICSQRKPRGFRCSARPAGSRPHSRASMQQSRAPRHWHERKDSWISSKW
jgi:hypothetical protein